MILENLFPDILSESLLRLNDIDVRNVFNRLQSNFLNRKLFKTIDQHRQKTLIEIKNGIELWEVKSYTTNDIEIYGLNRDLKEVSYFVRYEIQQSDFVHIPWATQVLVWGGSDPKAKDLPQYVFFKYIIGVTGTVVSDGEQTSRGEQFWDRMIRKCFLELDDFNIYLLNFHEREVKMILTYESYVKLIESPDSPWGNKRGFHNGLRIAISKFELDS